MEELEISIEKIDEKNIESETARSASQCSSKFISLPIPKQKRRKGKPLNNSDKCDEAIDIIGLMRV